jgi:hypothetical protein
VSQVVDISAYAHLLSSQQRQRLGLVGHQAAGAAPALLGPVAGKDGRPIIGSRVEGAVPIDAGDVPDTADNNDDEELDLGL